MSVFLFSANSLSFGKIQSGTGRAPHAHCFTRLWSSSLPSKLVIFRANSVCHVDPYSVRPMVWSWSWVMLTLNYWCYFVNSWLIMPVIRKLLCCIFGWISLFKSHSFFKIKWCWCYFILPFIKNFKCFHVYAPKRPVSDWQRVKISKFFPPLAFCLCKNALSSLFCSQKRICCCYLSSCNHCQ